MACRWMGELGGRGEARRVLLGARGQLASSAGALSEGLLGGAGMDELFGSEAVGGSCRGECTCRLQGKNVVQCGMTLWVIAREGRLG